MFEPISVLWLENTRSFRQVVSDWLRNAGFDVRDCGTVADFRTALEAAPRVDVVLLDLHLRGDIAHGSDLIPEVFAARPEAKVVIFTDHDDRNDGFLSVAASLNPHGVISKDEELEVLVEGIRDVCAGKHLMYTSPRIQPAVAALLTPRGHADVWALLDDELRGLLLRVARTDKLELAEFRKEVGLSESAWTRRLDKFKERFAEARVFDPSQESMTFTWLRSWSRDRGFNLQ